MKDIVFNPLLKISSVNRYSGVYLTKNESVSDHTTQTGLLCILVGNEINKRLAKLKSSVRVNLEKLAYKALIHDLEESKTCDTPRNVKYFNDLIYQEFERKGDELSELYEFPELYEQWKNAKDKTLEGYILKICDMIHVVRKLVDEVVLLGNLNMLQVALELKDHLKKTHDYINKITDLPAEAIDVFNELTIFSLDTVNYILKKHQSEITDYNFTSLKSA
ncbi:5'-nucleotidase protein [Rhizobium phage RHph_TM61]|nr:5'-nucleotidase protein [Rhizobium phage RHph_TM61]